MEAAAVGLEAAFRRAAIQLTEAGAADLPTEQQSAGLESRGTATRRQHRGERWGSGWQEGCESARREQEQELARHPQKRRRKGDMVGHDSNEDLFLPMTANGVPVLVHEGSGRYRVDNTLLQAATAGVAYRRTKDPKDKDPTRLAAWGSTVEGTDEGDDWVKVQLRVEERPSDRRPAPRLPARPRLQPEAGSLAVSEKMAREAVEASEFSMEKVLEVLRRTQVPANFTRKNVMPKGADFVQGLLLGLYAYGPSVGVSSATSKHPWLTKLLTGAIKQVAPDFPFTSIQLNYNYASRPHVDANNLGASFIIGLGDYSGGELWVHDETGQSAYVVDGDEDVTGYYRVGKEFSGSLLQIQNSWTIFDGTKLHFTRPFQGERYSIIFFTCDRYASASPEVRAAISAAGFDFDFGASNLEATLREKHERRAEIAKQVAAERKKAEQQRILLRGRCIGRVWADGWGLRCTAVCAEGSEFCGSHLQRDRWKTHGRMDGDPPPAKKQEMAKTQRRHVQEGRMPPVQEGATILVPIPAITRPEDFFKVRTSEMRSTSSNESGLVPHGANVTHCAKDEQPESRRDELEAESTELIKSRQPELIPSGRLHRSDSEPSELN